MYIKVIDGLEHLKYNLSNNTSLYLIFWGLVIGLSNHLYFKWFQMVGNILCFIVIYINNPGKNDKKLIYHSKRIRWDLLLGSIFLVQACFTYKTKDFLEWFPIIDSKNILFIIKLVQDQGHRHFHFTLKTVSVGLLDYYLTYFSVLETIDKRLLFT